MKFAVAALLVAGSSAVLLEDDCGGKWCNKGLPYDLDVPRLDRAKADNVAKTQAYNGAKLALEQAEADLKAAKAKQAATKKADDAAGAAKAKAAAKFAATNYKDRKKFEKAEAKNAKAVKAKEQTLDAYLKAYDDREAKQHIRDRKKRDHKAAKAAKKASDARLKRNKDRVAYEKDQLVRGQDQDRLKFVNQDTTAKTSEILGKHDERERANKRLFKALASF